MAEHKRQSLYYNEENLYLYEFVKNKRKSNDWVIELIKREYLREKGLFSQETAPTQMPATPSMDSQMVEQLTQQIQALSQQFVEQQALVQQVVQQQAQLVVPPVEKTIFTPEPMSPQPAPKPVETMTPVEPVIKTKPKVNKKFASTDF